MNAVKPWLAQCVSCGFLFSSLPAGAGTGVEGLKALRMKNYRAILDVILKHTELSGKTLLEVGCARGWFVQAAERHGAMVQGLEPEHRNAALAQLAGLPVREGFFPQALDRDSRYDLIVFNDVFEHLPDPVRAIRAVEHHLRPGGHAVINVPSADGVIYKLSSLLDRIGISGPFDRLWQRGLASPHISYFAPETLDRLVTTHTALRCVYSGPLDVLTRQDLWPRLRSTYSRPASAAIFPLAWAGSFALGSLPPDIVLLMFEKPGK